MKKVYKKIQIELLNKIDVSIWHQNRRAFNLSKNKLWFHLHDRIWENLVETQNEKGEYIQ